MLGFANWAAMMKAMAKGEKGEPDAAMPAAVVNARRILQEAVLRKRLGMGEQAARGGAEDAGGQRTPRSKPSLAGFAEKANNLLFPDVEGVDLSQGLADLMRSVGIDPGDDPMAAMDAMRTQMHGFDAMAWIAFLEQVFGWRLEDRDEKATKHGTRFATVVTGDGRRLPVHGSVIGYRPRRRRGRAGGGS